MWYRLIDWFGEMRERHLLIRDFNRSSKNAFVAGVSPTCLEAKITKGDSSYRHSFSKFLGGGFRIKALSGRPLTRNEVIEIGKIILDHEELVRKLIVLGWDTLEVHDDAGINGCKWALKDYGKLGGLLN